MLCKWIVDFIHNLLPLNAGKEVLVTTQRKIYNLLSRRATDHNFHLLMKCRHAFDFSRPCSSPRRWMGRRCRLRMVESTSGMTLGRTIRGSTQLEVERYGSRARSCRSGSRGSWLHTFPKDKFGVRRRFPEMWCYSRGWVPLPQVQGTCPDG